MYTLLLAFCIFFSLYSFASTSSTVPTFSIKIPKFYTTDLEEYFENNLTNIKLYVADVNNFLNSSSSKDRLFLVSIFQVFFKIKTDYFIKSVNLETFERYQITLDFIWNITEKFRNDEKFLSLLEGCGTVGELLSQIIRFESVFPIQKEYKDFVELVTESTFIDNCLGDIIELGKFESECLSLQELDETQRTLALSSFEKIKNRFLKPFFNEYSQDEIYGKISPDFDWLDLAEYPIFEFLCNYYSGKKEEALNFILFNYRDDLYPIIKDMDTLGILEKLKNYFSDIAKDILNEEDQLEKFESLKGKFQEKFRETHHFTSKSDTPLDNLKTQEQGNPTNKGTQDQGIPTDKESQDQGNPPNKVIQVQENPTDKGAQDQGNFTDKGIQVQEYPTNKGIQVQENLTNKGAQDQENPTDKGTQEQGIPTSQGTQEQGNLIDKGAQDHGNPIDKEAQDQGDHTSKGTQDQGNPTNKGVQDKGDSHKFQTQSSNSPNSDKFKRNIFILIFVLALLSSIFALSIFIIRSKKS
jgi:hypothetical protein